MLVFWLAAVLITAYYLNEFFQRFRTRKCPPGPMPIPVIGNIIQVALAHDVPNLALSKLSEKYGEIYRLNIGVKQIVVLSSYEAIRECFSRKEAMGRDFTGTFVDRNRGKNSGIILSDGPRSEKLRAWTIRNLKDYGFNKTSTMEASITEDIEAMFETMDKLIGSDGEGVLDVSECFIVPIVKFTWKLIVGHCTPEDEEVLKRLTSKSEEMVKSGVFGVGVVNAFPFVRFIFPNWTGKTVQMAFYNECYKVSENLLRQTRKAGPIDTPTTFVEAFAKKMDEVGNNPELLELFNEHEFSVTFMDFFQAASDTSSSYLESIILYMVLYPDVQAKVFQEIKNTIPQGQGLEFEDCKSMIYTQAVMLEAHRHAKTVQNLIPHRVTQDFVYKDYTIAKGTVLIADLHTPYFLGKIWEDADLFRPERFIGNSGEIINKQYVLPFSIGLRKCPGENLGEITTSLFFISILRKYKLSVIPGQTPPREDMHVVFTSRPYPFKIVISKRK